MKNIFFFIGLLLLGFIFSGFQEEKTIKDNPSLKNALSGSALRKFNRGQKLTGKAKLILDEAERYEQQIEEIKQKLQEKIKFVSSSTRKKGDEAGVLINTAFNNLVQKLHNIKGEQFSEELQKIADLVLEKRGFSVTLHKLRSLINQYRFSDNSLNENDTKLIIENIESWKEKLI